MPRRFTVRASCGQRVSGQGNERAEAIAEALFGEVLQKPGAPVCAHPLGGGGIAQQLDEAFAQRRDVAGRHEPATVAVGDDLAGGTWGADAWPPRAPRLDAYER